MASPPVQSGKITEKSFCEVLAALCRDRATGVLELSGNGPAKSVFLKDGSVVFASSRDPDDRLGELLLSRAVIRQEQLDRASTQVGAGKRLGTILVELGFLPASDLPRWVREQVKEILFSLFPWTAGEYRFTPGPYSSDEAITLRIPTAEVFLTGLRRVQKWSVLRKGVGEPRVPYRLTGSHAERMNELNLGPAERRLVELLEAHPLTLEEAAVESSLTPLLVGQIFFALRVLEIAVPDPAREEPGTAEAAAGAMTVMMKIPIPGERSVGSNLEAAAAAPSSIAPAPPHAVPVAGVEAEEPAPVSAAAPSPRISAPARQQETPGPAERLVSSGPALTDASDAPATEPSKKGTTPPTADSSTKRPPKSAVGPAAAKEPSEPMAPPAPVSTPSKTAAAESAPSRRKAEYRVVRVEAEKIHGDGGVQPLEELLRSWSQKGFRLAGVVPGVASGLFGSAAPTYFIFSRE